MARNDSSAKVYLTLQEVRKELQSINARANDKRLYYNLFAIVTQVCGANFQTKFLVYRIKDETAEEAVLSIKTTPYTSHPPIKVGDVVRLHRCAVKLYNDALECNIFKPESIVVYPKNDGNQVNPVSVAKKPSSDPSDIVKVTDLFALNVSLPSGEPHTFSNVLDNGQETDIIAQLVGIYVLNNQKGAFAFVWDGTKCPVKNLKHFEGFRLDDRENIKQCDSVLLNRSEGLLHHLFIFDNIVQRLLSMELGSFMLLEGVRVAFKKNTNQVYLTCKGRISLLNENNLSCVKLKERLSRVPIPPAREESDGKESSIKTLECIAGKNNDTEPVNENQATNEDNESASGNESANENQEPKSSDNEPANENQEIKSSNVMKEVQKVIDSGISVVVAMEKLVDLIPETLVNQDAGTSLLTDIKKKIQNNEPSNSITSFKDQTLAVDVPKGVEDQLSRKSIHSVPRPMPNQDANTLVSVPIEKENCDKDLEQQDVSNDDVCKKTSESIPISDIISISRQNKKKVTGTLILHGLKKKFYVIPQEKLDQFSKYLENYRGLESSDSSRYATAESSPISSHVSEMDSQSSFISCDDSNENEIDTTYLRLESSSCSSSSSLSNLSIFSIQGQVGSQLDLPETPECSQSMESQNLERTQSVSLLQNITQTYEKSNLVSKAKDVASFAQFKEAQTRKRPYNTWDETVEWIEEEYKSKFEQATKLPLRKKLKTITEKLC